MLQISTKSLIAGLFIAAFSCVAADAQITDEVAGTKLTAERIFDSSRLHDVQIELAADDWNQLRKQTRGRGGFASIFSNTSSKPFTYFKGSVTLDGKKIGDVGIRKKGFIGSLDEVRPSLKIKFSEYVKQSPVEGIDRLTLNNNKQDTALVSQFLSYRVFQDAGVESPRCSFAKVTVNGDYLGIYSNVESYKKPFLKDRYGDDSGNLYEGTLADFYPRTVDKLEVKTNSEKNDRQKVARLAGILASDKELPMTEVSELVDVDKFLAFWAVESLIGFWDGYTQNQNNFFVYEHPGNGKYYFMPWGADSCFTSGGGPFARFSGGKRTASIQAESMLSNRLFHAQGMPERYRDAMRSVLATAWQEDELIKEIDRLEELLQDHLHPAQVPSAGRRPWGSPLTMDGVRKFVKTRRAKVESELKDWPVEVAAKPRKPMYTIQVGSASGSFTTAWSASGNGDEEGELQLQLRLGDEDVTLTDLNISASPMRFRGFGRPGRGDWTPPATIVLTGIRESDDELLTLTCMLDQQQLSQGAGKQLSFSGSLSEGTSRGFGFGPGGKMINGVLDLTKAGTKDGDLIVGKLEAKIIEMHGGMMDRSRRGGERRRSRPR